MLNSPMSDEAYLRMDRDDIDDVAMDSESRTVSILLKVTVDCEWMLEGDDAGSINAFIGSIEYLARDFYRKPISAIRLQ